MEGQFKRLFGHWFYQFAWSYWAECLWPRRSLRMYAHFVQVYDGCWLSKKDQGFLTYNGWPQPWISWIAGSPLFTQFWKNIAFSSPLYAADIQMTLMDQSSGSWNLNSLDSVLTAGMKYPLPGVNTPYCYFGSWKTFFCWHTEDMDLAAINFLHAGKTKYWYSISIGDRPILESEAKLEFPTRI